MSIKRNPLGSDVFQTDVVKTNEYLIFAKNMADGNVPVPIIAARISAIDKMLLMQKHGCLNSMHMFTKSGRKRKDVGLLAMFEKIIGNLIDEETQILNSLKLNK